MKDYKKLTPIFVIGAMKAGTTTIYNSLKLNSEICFPTKKEPSYFCEKMGNPDFKKASFFDLYDFKSFHKYFYDGSTNYTKYPAETNVPKKIFEYGLKPKFVYVVRNPFERIESHYNYSRQHLKWEQHKLTSDFLISTSNYYLQLVQFEKYFDKKDFLIIDFDDLKRNQLTTLKKINDFIGVDEIILPERPLHSNQAKEISVAEIKMRKQIGSSFRFLSPDSKRFLIRVFRLFFGKRRKGLSKKQKKYVYSRLNPDMQKFAREYNFDVKKWGF